MEILKEIPMVSYWKDEKVDESMDKEKLLEVINHLGKEMRYFRELLEDVKSALPLDVRLKYRI